MSILEAYKEIVSQVYKLTQLSYQHQDTSGEFDSFLNHLQDVLERKQQQTIHIPPHVEIISEPVIVVKDDTVKNITLRHIPPTTEIQEDERLDGEENELIHEVKDDTMLAKDMIGANLDEEINIEEAIADAEAEGEEAISKEMGSLSLNLDKSDEDDDDDDDDDDQDKDLYIKTYKKAKYFVSMESKRVYLYINDTNHGAQVGKLENGKIVLM